MKIVIDISEEDYADCLHYVVDKDNCYPYSDFNLREVIRNGTVLPKGHGRLIDVDTISGHPRYDAEGFEVGEDLDWSDIENTNTVIPADKEA